MKNDEMIQEVIKFAKTCPNCGVVEGFIRRETEDKFELLCPKCGAVRFYSCKAGDEYVTLNNEQKDCSTEWRTFYGEPPIEKK